MQGLLLKASLIILGCAAAAGTATLIRVRMRGAGSDNVVGGRSPGRAALTAAALAAVGAAAGILIANWRAT